MSYEMGVVYVWNKVEGWASVLEGTECMVTGPIDPIGGGFPTDSPDPLPPFSYIVYASPGELRRKQPPTGEASVLNMFVVAPPKRMKEPA